MQLLKSHWKVLSPDVSKFQVVLRKVRACDPTGVDEKNIESMDVAVHMNTVDTMSDTYKKCAA